MLDKAVAYTQLSSPR